MIKGSIQEDITTINIYAPNIGAPQYVRQMLTSMKGEINNNTKITNLKNIQATPTAQFQKNKQPNQKIGQRTKQIFLQRRHTNGKETHEKILNITHYQRNVN